MQAKYLDPAILGSIGSLDVVARQVVEGVRIGMHRSPARGISSEFTAYRQYVPGDEASAIDWKSYARSDRYYVKLFEAETNFVSNLLVDVSGSMTYGSGKITKLEYAKYMAASLAYLITDQGDSVGAAVFDGEIQTILPPKSRKGIINDISRAFERVEPKPRTNVGAVLGNFAHRMARRGVVVLFSDMLDSTDEFVKGINHLRFRGHNVIVFHILDPFELEFPFKGTSKFVGLEDDGELVTQPDRLRENYLKELDKLISGIRGACAKAEVDYVLVNTAEPIEHVLSGYLLQRGLMHQ
ncbi:MAG: DUF58 domain-containing protein [Luteolibacter sp.]